MATRIQKYLVFAVLLKRCIRDKAVFTAGVCPSSGAFDDQVAPSAAHRGPKPPNAIWSGNVVESEQTLTQSVDHGLGSRTDTEFVEDVTEVRLDRAMANGEPVRDLSVGDALASQL
jgi:hypothetical protein